MPPACVPASPRISHTGAQALIALLRDKGFTGECLNVVYEPVTGAHVGPGTVALFFYGTEK